MQVEIKNGIFEVTLSNPDGIVTGVRYNGVDNLMEILNKEDKRGYLPDNFAYAFYPLFDMFNLVPHADCVASIVRFFFSFNSLNIFTFYY